MSELDDDAMRAANWLCDHGWIDDRRAEPGWLADVAETLQGAVDRWAEMPAGRRRLPGPWFRRGDGHVRVEVLWVESKAGPCPQALADMMLAYGQREGAT